MIQLSYRGRDELIHSKWPLPLMEQSTASPPEKQFAMTASERLPARHLSERDVPRQPRREKFGCHSSNLLRECRVTLITKFPQVVGYMELYTYLRSIFQGRRDRWTKEDLSSWTLKFPKL